jgi:hypothetical protein
VVTAFFHAVAAGQRVANASYAWARAEGNSDRAFTAWVVNPDESSDELLWDEYLRCVAYAECRRRELRTIDGTYDEALQYEKALLESIHRTLGLA